MVEFGNSLDFELLVLHFDAKILYLPLCEYSKKLDKIKVWGCILEHVY